MSLSTRLLFAAAGVVLYIAIDQTRLWIVERRFRKEIDKHFPKGGA